METNISYLFISYNHLKNDWHHIQIAKIMYWLHYKIRKLEPKAEEKETASKVVQWHFWENRHQFLLKNTKKEKKKANLQPSVKKISERLVHQRILKWYTQKRQIRSFEGYKKLLKPVTDIDTKPSSLSELNAYLHQMFTRKRNVSAPGTISTPYLVWKKCPRITQLLTKWFATSGGVLQFSRTGRSEKLFLSTKTRILLQTPHTEELKWKP